MWLQIGWQLQPFKSKVNGRQHIKITEQHPSNILITYLFMDQFRTIRE